MGGNLLRAFFWVWLQQLAAHNIMSHSIMYNTSLSCLTCYNGQPFVDCVTFVNASEIPVEICGQHQPFCKVRRLHTEDKLTSLERGCDDKCTPGCTDTGLYLECFSCCSESLCNADNLAKSIHSTELFISWTIQKLIVSVIFIIKYI